MKEVKMEEQPNENEEQIMEHEEKNQPTVEQDEKGDQYIPKNWY